MHPIRHCHSRFINAPASRVRPVLEALWSGRRGDAFPYDYIRPWRRVAEGGTGFSLGTRFGHGPYRFVIDCCDERRVFARIETPGYQGSHGFELSEEQGGTRVVHSLLASAAPAEWLLWTLLVGAGHDWAVRSCLARLEGLVTAGDADACPVERMPWQLRAFIAIRKASRRLAPHTSSGPGRS